MAEYRSQVDTLMTSTLQLAQEQIKTYIDEQRRVSVIDVDLTHC